MDYARAMAAGVLLGIMASDLPGAADVDRELLVLSIILLSVVLLLIVPDAVNLYRQARRKG